MMRLTAVVALFPGLGPSELTGWVARGWVHPVPDDPEPVFRDIDIARIRLIHDLRTLMRIEDETIPVILSLLDQVYDERARLSAVLRAVGSQPAPVRAAILAAIL